MLNLAAMGQGSWRVSAVLSALVVALAAVITACGGDSGPSPTPDPAFQPYYTQLDAIFKKASDDSFAANDQLDSTLSEAPDLDSEKAAFDTFLTSTEDVFTTAITSMNGLTVPPELKADHDAFVQAATSSRDLARQLQSGLAGVTTEEQLQTMLTDFDNDKQPLLDSGDTACTNLQTAAKQHGINVNLACTGE